jgi:hypothetical protein
MIACVFNRLGGGRGIFGSVYEVTLSRNLNVCVRVRVCVCHSVCGVTGVCGVVCESIA